MSENESVETIVRLAVEAALATARTAADVKYLTTEQACTRLGISRGTLSAMARRHRMRRLKIGRSVRWPVRELERVEELVEKRAR